MIQFIVKFLVWMVFVSMTSSEIHQGGGAIELTSRTFDKSVRDGSVWIIELYAPWCIHCRTFAPSYENFARLLHAENKKGVKQIKVAKVDADSERAIVSRFNIAGFPSFYLIDGWKVYEYNEDLSAASMMSFAKGGYKQQEALPFYSSPMGPLGQIQSMLLVIAIQILTTFEWMQEYFGLSPIVAGLVMASTVLFSGVACMILLVFMWVSKQKLD